MTEPTREAIMQQAEGIPAPPVAIEAFWDGDTTGWFVVLTMLYVDGSAAEHQHREYPLADLRGEGGDLRLFNGQAPPWPEAARAKDIGEELASRFAVPFYFPSPDHPEDSCPRWWEQSRGYPCRRCGIPLLQRDPCPWRGVCYFCHLAEEKEAKEARWSPEDRAGPRCEICGDPASNAPSRFLRCSRCLDRYDDYDCSRCGNHVCVLKTLAHTDICHFCDLLARLAEVSEADRQTIRAASATGGEFDRLDVAMRILGWSLHDAAFAVRKICGDA
jgi:hypothetical protein